MNFYGLTLNELSFWCEENLYNKTNATKLFQLLYKNKLTLTEVESKNASTHPPIFPKNFIEHIKNVFDFSLPKIRTAKISQDQTIKLLLEFHDGRSVETVVIPFHNKRTICLSTQVGCAMNCSFCYTGTQGLTRNLSAHEIVGLYLVSYQYFEMITKEKQTKPNIVYMGQGEPLHNFDEVKKATEIFLETFGIELGPRNITLSTAGYLPGILKLKDFPRINLALSLHSALDSKRNELIPLNIKYPLKDVLKNLEELPRLKRQYIMCEYLMIKEFNDQEEDLLALVEALKDLPAIVNLIPFNPFPGAKYQRPEMSEVEKFQQKLEANDIPAMIRTTKGDEILAACGQLYIDELNKKKKIEQVIE